MSWRRRSMVRMSRTRGTRLRTTLSSVRSAAASAGSAEFLEPLVGMVPCSFGPPSMTNLSIQFIVGYQVVYGSADVVACGFEGGGGLFGSGSGGGADDADGAVEKLSVFRLH